MQARIRAAAAAAGATAVALTLGLALGPARADLTGSTSPVSDSSTSKLWTSNSLPMYHSTKKPKPIRKRPVPTTTKPGKVKPTPGPTAGPTTAPVLVPTPTRAATPTVRPTAPTTTPVGSSAITTAALPNRSGLNWASGVYVSNDTVAQTEQFAAWRGRPVDVVVAWPARSTWSDIESPGWLYQIWDNTPYTKVFGVAPIPEGESSSLADCAAGDYDQHWVRFAQNIKAAGLDDETVIRLGWEFNGNWYKWKATDPAAFAGCWRRIHTAAESVAPLLRWDWTVNRGVGQGVADARQAYPGDAYVDFIGVDSYDAWPAANTEAGWQAQYSGPFGLKFWAAFAEAHHKLFSVPEWGVYPGTSGSGGDNPFYIAKMEAFFRSLGAKLGYESYFNEDKSYCASSLVGPNLNPKAATQYRKDMQN